MDEHISPAAETENDKPLAPLIERLDPSIGEVSTVMGAMMTELIRRALRGSVRQIDDELQAQAAQKLDATIAQRLPDIEQSAADAADKAAREAATEVAVEEVHALEQRTREAERDMVSRIQSTAVAAEEHTAQAARTLTGQIERAEKKAELAISSKAQELTSRIEEAAKTVTTMTEEKAHELSRHIEEAERRVNEAAQAETTRQVEDLLQRSRKTTAGIKDRLQALEDRQSRLEQQLAEARRRNEALAGRITELEKPRGLRALWAWLFGRRKKQPAAAAPTASDVDPADNAAEGRETDR